IPYGYHITCGFGATGHRVSGRARPGLRTRMLLIGDLAEQAGLTTSAIRYYEQLGLVRPKAQTTGEAWSRQRSAKSKRASTGSKP
ncbi:MAG TPA: MerR family transcriptional regulator, partial [Acidimicrobiales bacterium]|nr:MerR family transcriptional regulator [Acidimicrobiales bacterium]